MLVSVVVVLIDATSAFGRMRFCDPYRFHLRVTRISHMYVIQQNRVSLAGVLYDTHLASISSVVAVDNSFRASLEHSIAGESGDIGPASPQLSHSATVRKPR
jgi:hypothetical protein